MNPLTWLSVIGTAVLLGGALLGLRGCHEGLREEGRAEVRLDWIIADNARELEERQALIDKQRSEREEEQRMAKAKEESDRAIANRENDLRQRAADAERTADGLRGTIARLDAESRARRAAGTCAAAEREADAAAAARGLLAACSGRYTALAAHAGELASQVIGLQDHIVVVQPEAAALLTEDE